MNTLYLDLETYSEIDLYTCGGYRYAEACEIMLWGYALDDGPVGVWDLTAGGHMPPDLGSYLYTADTLCAHNSQFDRVVLRRSTFGWQYNFDIPRWRDTMIRAYAHGLPGSLDALCDIFKLDGAEAKQKTGRQLVNLFCKPQKIGQVRRRTRETNPAEWEDFKEYLRHDILSMRRLDKILPTWNDTKAERDLWHLDQVINDLGVKVDKDLASAALIAVAKEKAQKDLQTQLATDDVVSSATKRDQLLQHILQEYGIVLPDMKEATLLRRFEDPTLPDGVKTLIGLRLDSCGMSTKKYDRMLHAACADGRIKGMTQFCGAARTGRDGGRIVQLQNLPRPTHKNYVIDAAIADVKNGGMLDAIESGCADVLYGGAISVLTSAIRGALVPAGGKKFVVSDLSAIEDRTLAWVAEEEWKVQAYRGIDAGTNPFDLYKLTYATMFGVAPETVGKAERQLGKTLSLACGYGGSVGAFVTFANINHIDLSELHLAARPNIPGHVWDAAARYYEKAKEQGKTLGLIKEVFCTCDSLKRMWREANPYIEQFWNEIDNAVRAVLQGDARFVSVNSIAVDKQGVWLRIQLPSGRFLCYPSAKLSDGKIEYLGMNQYSKKWGWVRSYGAKFVENIVQAIARDILLQHAMPIADRAGYSVVVRVHDELICETPDTAEFTHQGLSKILSITPAWAPGLPLAAAGFEAYRYRKD